MNTERNGIETLRYAVKLFDGCMESFNEKYTAEQLIKMAKIMPYLEWDFGPHVWTDRQVRGAIYRGLAPQWKEADNGFIVPVYPGKKVLDLVLV